MQNSIIEEKALKAMTKREVVKMVLDGQRPPYVPWQIELTLEAREALKAHYACGDDDQLTEILGNHFLQLGDSYGFFEPVGNDRFRDYFGVIWNREVDKDIGVVEGQVLPAPTLNGYTFPDPYSDKIFGGTEEKIARHPDRFRVFNLGFSLFERAWTLRGMMELYMDFMDHPEFVHDLLGAITDWNLKVVERALTYDIDAVYFGDDWGQQHGLLMGYPCWRKFIYPQLKRLYSRVHAAGKKVVIHSCGDVDELFDDLHDIGVNLFNPFQPEVMDVLQLMEDYRGRLSFWGGLSTQRVLPYGSVADVKKAVATLMERGSRGGLVLGPAHAIEGDVPLENMLAMIDLLQAQKNITKG